MSVDFKNKKIAILGLGVEGFSSTKFLVRRGAKVTILDQKTKQELDPEMLREANKLDVSFVLGEHYLDDLSSFDLIVRSPGIRPTITELSKAKKNGAVITSHTKLFFDLCPCPIIGVTGTKGKGTTAALIDEMLRRDGFEVYLGGNIGKPPIEFLDKLSTRSWVVLELSSYQLQDLTKSPAWPAGRPHIAVVLMVTREHLAPDRGGKHENYHPSIEDYISAKRNILRYQTASNVAILNNDYPASRESDIHTQAQVFSVSTETEVEEGCFVKDGKVVVRVARGPAGRLPRPTSSVDRLPAGARRGSPAPVTPRLLEIINTSNILLPGRHNLQNVCAAVMAATIAGVSKKSIVKALREFRGLDHRLELVGEINGVRYYDDSFSTTPETAIAAIQAFTQPEILILGGAHKGSDFGNLGRVLKDAKNIKAVIGIGIEWERMKSQFPISSASGRIPMIEGLKNMREIIRKAAEIAEAGDVVLLSPACSSFDMFKNYKERGEQFKREVHKLSVK